MKKGLDSLEENTTHAQRCSIILLAPRARARPSPGVAVVRAVGAMLSARHGAERLQNCWHGGGATVEALRGAMDTLLQEYAASGDVREAARCLMELGVPHYHHELVLRALRAAFDAEAAGRDGRRMLSLLRALEASGEINDVRGAGFVSWR